MTQEQVLEAVRAEVKRIGSIKGCVEQWAGAQSVLYMLEKRFAESKTETV